MLADPYFPRFGAMDAEMQAIIGRTYDFVVRYENVLALNTVDATESRADALTVDGIATGGRSAYDRLVVVVRQGAGFETFNLVNLVGLAHGLWHEALPGGPAPQADLAVRIRVDAPVSRIWAASPDGDDASARILDFTTGSDADGDFVTFTLPRLDYWQMIVLDYAS
jgi:dextranase